ncbi:MAG: hypothetical protein ABIB04_03835 [Patescibacteria group bacterium]
MTADSANEKILDVVQGLSKDMAGLSKGVAGLTKDMTDLKSTVNILAKDVTELKTDVAGLKSDVTELKTDVAGLKSVSQEHTTSIQDILEAVHDLSSHTDDQFRRLDERFATKDDLLGFATKDDLQEFKQEILTHVDWFATHHRTVDIEISSLRNASLRHEERITALEENARP